MNTTVQTILGFTVSFDVEQWYRGANAPQATNTLHLYYRVWSASTSELVEIGNQLGAEWTHIPDASFTSPNAAFTTAEALDGNLAENRGFVSVTVDDIILNPGEKLWLQWITGDEPGRDHVFATDNVSVSFITAPIPEPAAVAGLAGFAAFIFTALRRRR